jgi:hypothetical protein
MMMIPVNHNSEFRGPLEASMHFPDPKVIRNIACITVTLVSKASGLYTAS